MFPGPWAPCTTDAALQQSFIQLTWTWFTILVKYERRPCYLFSSMIHKCLLSIYGVWMLFPQGMSNGGVQATLSDICHPPEYNVSGGLPWWLSGVVDGLSNQFGWYVWKVISSSALVDSVATVLICFLFKLNFRKMLGKKDALKLKPFIF